jgi:hypothetical protein
MSKLSKKLQQFSATFERRERANGETFVCLADNKKDWMENAVFAAHDAGNIGPNDSTYLLIEKVVDHLANAEPKDADEAYQALNEIESDIYTHDLLRWLSSSLYNVEYLETAVVEYGAIDGFGILSLAQYAALQEIGSAVINSICSDLNIS